MKILNLLTILALLMFSACSRGGDSNPVPGAAGSLVDSQGNALALDVAALPIQQLSTHENLIIQNNTKRAIELFAKNDLGEGMISLTAVASLPGELTSSQMAAVNQTMEEVAKVASAAAEAGNENAQYAMQVLNAFLGGQ